MGRKSSIFTFVLISTLLTPAKAPAGEVGESSSKSQCSEYRAKSFEGIGGLQAEDEQCDVTFIVGDIRFRVHKVVMSAGSPYFEAMFRHEMRESVSAEPISLHYLDAGAFEMIISYIYSGQITICDSNVIALLGAASYLQITDIEAYCCDHMKKNLDAINCLSIKCTTEKYQCGELLNRATELTLKSFEEIVKHPEFLELTKDQLIDIISDDRLNASEENIYEAAMHWIRYKDSPDGDRTVYLPDIMQHVRFPQMMPKYLVRVSEDSLIKACKKCLKYVKEAEKLSPHSMNSKIKQWLPFNRSVGHNSDESSLKERFKPRISDYLFVVGGEIGGVYKPTSSVERYDAKRNKWTEVASMNSEREWLGVAVLNNLLCAVGSWSSSYFLSTIECYDPHTDKWDANKITPLGSGRITYNRVVTVDGILYVVGAQDWHNSSLMVKYDPHTNEWIKCQPLRRDKTACAIAALDGYIYILGGYVDSQVSNVVERYDPTKNEWHDVSPMITKRHYFGSAAYERYLYVAGGRGEGHEAIDSAERYDSRTQQWEKIAPMTKLRWGHGLAVINGLIYAVGGDDLTNGDINTFEVYDPQKKVWSKRASMLKKRINFGLAAMTY